MSVFVTGDCHGDFSKFNMEVFPEQREMSRDDTVIITGDFGGVWAYDENTKGRYGWKAEQHQLDWLEGKSYTTVFCDGNHENFDRLYKFPVKEWNGGLVHVIRPNVLHLMRGQVFTIEGQKYFVFGGASSHDIGHGIIDPETDPDWKNKIKQFDREYIWDYRTNKRDWWKEESFVSMDEGDIKKEKEEAIKNLELANWNVRYIITHCIPSSTLYLYAKRIL